MCTSTLRRRSRARFVDVLCKACNATKPAKPVALLSGELLFATRLTSYYTNYYTNAGEYG